MPSRKSNKNLMHLPPLPAPQGRRCITVAVPDHPEWIALFYGALFRLGQQVWYDRDAAHSARDVAAVWQQVYLETLKETGDCMNGCLCYLRRNPATGRYQYSTDGLDWFEVSDGPWIDAPATPQWPDPIPREGTDNQKRCDAAYAAALVLQSLYQQTWGVFINWANWSAFTLAQEMADWADKILGGLFNFDTLISAANELHDNESAFQDGGFPDSLVTDVQNILYCQSSVADGAVVFDFDGVLADFAAVGTTPYPGLNFLLQLYIGEGGLNAAGNVQAGSGDCSGNDCDGPWCVHYDFTDYQTHDWELLSAYAAPQGLRGVFQNTNNNEDITIQQTGSEGYADHIELKFRRDCVGGTNQHTTVRLKLDGATVWEYDVFGGPTGNPATLSFDFEPVLFEQIYVDINAGSCNSAVWISELQISGPGINPLGTTNC